MNDLFRLLENLVLLMDTIAVVVSGAIIIKFPKKTEKAKTSTEEGLESTEIHFFGLPKNCMWKLLSLYVLNVLTIFVLCYCYIPSGRSGPKNVVPLLFIL